MKLNSVVFGSLLKQSLKGNFHTNHYFKLLVDEQLVNIFEIELAVHTSVAKFKVLVV